MTVARVPDPMLMDRLRLSVDGVAWAAALVAPWQHETVDGEWSPHQHVFHLLGNERIFQDRIRAIVSRDNPILERWDSEGFMEREYRTEPGIEELAREFALARQATVELFGDVTPEQWSRRATWPDGREMDLAWLAEKCAWHELEHLAVLLDYHGEFDRVQSERWQAHGS